MYFLGGIIMICKGRCGEKLKINRVSDERYMECDEAYIRYTYCKKGDTQLARDRMCNGCPKMENR
jgi:hypothetical protein